MVVVGWWWWWCCCCGVVKKRNRQGSSSKKVTTTTTGVSPSVPTVLMRHLFLMDPSEQPVTGAAQRRKQRRLRSWWRHEQQSTAAALATFTHHSAPRGQKKVRAGEEESELNYTAKVRKTPPPQPVLFSLSLDEEPGGARPPCLGEPRGPQEKVQQCTVE